MNEVRCNGLRAQELRPYFDIQLKFAERMGAGLGLEVGEWALRYTNLRRRMGFGDPEDPDNDDPRWLHFCGDLAACHTHEKRLETALQAFADAPEKPVIHRFGCFDYNAPNEDGIVRIHFVNVDTDELSPLDVSKFERRRLEMTALVEDLGREYPGAKAIRGTSWLYNTHAYCRLFPEAYVASRQPVGSSVRFTGSSSWGQFLDYRGQVKTQAIRIFEGNLSSLDAAAPWRSFPLQALRTQSDLGVFVSHYLK